jgi:hypothetical protein
MSLLSIKVGGRLLFSLPEVGVWTGVIHLIFYPLNKDFQRVDQWQDGFKVRGNLMKYFL